MNISPTFSLRQPPENENEKIAEISRPWTSARVQMLGRPWQIFNDELIIWEQDLLGVSGGERLEILGDAGLGGISDGEGGHAAVTHPEHDRPAERGEGN